MRRSVLLPPHRRSSVVAPGWLHPRRLRSKTGPAGRPSTDGPPGTRPAGEDEENPHSGERDPLRRSRDRQRHLRHPHHPLRDGPAGPSGRRLRRRLPGRRHHGAVGHQRLEAAQGALRLLPPHGGRRGAHVRGRPDPRFLLPPRGPPLRGRDPHLPADRPPAAPVLRQGPAQRDPGRLHDHGAQPRPPLRRGRDQRRLLLHAAGGPALLRPDRRRPRRADQGPVGGVPDPQRAGGGRLRHGRRRPGARRTATSRS